MSTTTHTTTEPPLVVNPDILKAVREYLKANEEHNKAEIKLESRYWPMVEEALKMIDQGIEQEEITSQFRAAFDKATEKVDKASAQRISMRLMSTRVTKMALKGRDFIEAARKAGKGFWKIAHEIETAAKEEKTKVSTPSATPDSVTSNGDEHTDKPAASNRSGRVKVGQTSKRGAKAEPATEKIIIGKDQPANYDVALRILEMEPNLLLELVEELARIGKVVYVDLIRSLIEQAKLPNDAIESLLKEGLKLKKGTHKSLEEIKA